MFATVYTLRLTTDFTIIPVKPYIPSIAGSSAGLLSISESD